MQKKASGTATPGKSPLLPIFERGSSQCRAQHSWLTNSYVRARSCSLFSSFKKGKAFSLRCLSPLCSPAVDARHTQIAVLGMFQCSLDDGAAQKNRIVFSAVDAIHTPITLLGMLRCSLDIFVTQNASVVSNPRWHFYASHEACRRMAVYISQLTGNRTRPASREACCRAAVIQRPSRMSHWHPARPWRAVRG